MHMRRSCSFSLLLMCTSPPTATAMSFSAKPRHDSRLIYLACSLLVIRWYQIEDMNSQAQMSAAQQMPTGAGGGIANLENSGAGGDDEDDDDIPELEAPEEDGPIDESGVEPKDIDLVMAQVPHSPHIRGTGSDILG
jgi:hypothetical protein